jgi:hypothetical protein
VTLDITVICGLESGVRVQKLSLPGPQVTKHAWLGGLCIMQMLMIMTFGGVSSRCLELAEVLKALDGLEHVSR